MTPDRTEPGDLYRRVVRGVGWMLASQGSTQILAFLTSVVIARLLSPRDIGLAAEAVVFGSLALVIADFGIASVIIQRPTLSDRDTSTAFWTSMILGAGLTAAGVGLSWPIASLFGQPRVQMLFATLSFTFLLTSPGIIQGALLSRELKFRALEIRGMISTAVACVTAMVLAALGFGPWAIIVQALTVSATSTLLLWWSSPWRPRLVFSMHSLRGMRGFAGNTFGSNALSWGVLNLDNLLVGRFLGAAPLGVYSLAYSVALAPLNRVAMPIGQVFFPALSRVQDPQRIGAAWLRGLRMVALVVIPVMLGVIVIAPDLVLVVFGAKWLPAVPVLRLLAPIGLLQALTALNSGVLSSIGRARTLLRITILISVTSVAAFAVGLAWGLTGVATTYLVASCVVQPLSMAIAARTVGLTLSDCLVSIRGVLEAGIGMLAVTLVARELLLSSGVPAAPRLVIVVICGALSYIPLAVWRAPEARRELMQLRRRRTEGDDETDPPPPAARSFSPEAGEAGA